MLSNNLCWISEKQIKQDQADLPNISHLYWTGAFMTFTNFHSLAPGYGMPKRKKIQDLENHTKTIVLNQENNISYPRFLNITARNFIHVHDVVNTCVKMKIYMQE